MTADYEPSTDDLCSPNPSGSIVWEGGDGVECTFPSGVTFDVVLAADAASATDYTAVG